MPATNLDLDLRLEHVPCALCGADDARPYIETYDQLASATGRPFRFVQCWNCGLLYLDPRPDPTSLGAYYPDDYAPFRRRGVTRRVREWQYRRSVRDLWPLLAPPRRIVDVGCGAGELLAVIRAGGSPDVLGIEPSSTAAEIAREVRDLPVVTGTLESAELGESSIDTVLMSHVIEHLPDPVGTLREVWRVLKPGGALVLWLPNADSVPARILGPYWMGWDAPRHLYAFSHATLRRLLDERGFTIEDTYHERHGIEWSWGIRLWTRRRLKLRAADAALAAVHPVLGIALTPLATITALLGRAGRIRVVARKSDQ